MTGVDSYKNFDEDDCNPFAQLNVAALFGSDQKSLRKWWTSWWVCSCYKKRVVSVAYFKLPFPRAWVHSLRLLEILATCCLMMKTEARERTGLDGFAGVPYGKMKAKGNSHHRNFTNKQSATATVSSYYRVFSWCRRWWEWETNVIISQYNITCATSLFQHLILAKWSNGSKWTHSLLQPWSIYLPVIYFPRAHILPS